MKAKLTGESRLANVFALLALSLVIATWLILVVRIFTGDIFGLSDSPLDWLYLSVGAGGIVCAAGSVARIRTGDDPYLAVSVLAFSLLLPALYALFFWTLSTLPPAGGPD